MKLFFDRPDSMPDIVIYDQIEVDALTMADMMAEGIIRQLHKSEKVCFISGI